MDGIALASVITSGIVGLGGLTVAAVTSGKDRDAARSLALDQARLQRRADAYVEVLRVAETAGQWASTTTPSLDFGDPVPPLPDLAAQAQVQALVGAFGSTEVRDLERAWRDSVRAVIKAVQAINVATSTEGRHGVTGIDKMGTWRRLDEELRPAERAAREALADGIARELGHRP